MNRLIDERRFKMILQELKERALPELREIERRQEASPEGATDE